MVHGEGEMRLFRAEVECVVKPLSDLVPMQLPDTHPDMSVSVNVMLTCHKDLPHGSNLTIECLRRTVLLVRERRGGSLPPILYLQMDNTCRENKNR